MGHLPSRLPAEDGPPGRPQAGTSLDYVEKVLTAGVRVVGAAYGGGMQLSDWAEKHARDLLSPLGDRWRHAQAVARAARELSQQLNLDDREALIASAYLHDVGYSEELVDFGFHPLDGARHLLVLDQVRLAGLVAHHTGARHEAELRGLQDELADFEDEQTIVSAALAYSDLTTGPDGEVVSPEHRLRDVESRYGEDSLVAAGLVAAWPKLMEAVTKVEDLLAKASVPDHPT